MDEKLKNAIADYNKLKVEKAKVEENNAKVLKQLSSMKELITDTKEREAMNKELLIKVKAKSTKLSESMANEKALRERVRELEKDVREARTN